MKHIYRPLYRPAPFAGLPKGWDFVEVPIELAGSRRDLPVSRYRHGVIGYDRKLTVEEVADHQLEYLGERL